MKGSGGKSENSNNVVSWPVSRVLSGVTSATAIHLGRPSLGASSNQPGWRAWKRACRLDFSTCWPSLFGLAPDGVCRAGAVTGAAVRSYRTVSPLLASALTGSRTAGLAGLPRRCSKAAKAGGLFSVALSLGSPPAAVNRHPVSMEPGLSSTGTQVWAITPRPAAAVRPTDTEISGLAGANRQATVAPNLKTSSPFQPDRPAGSVAY